MVVYIKCFEIFVKLICLMGYANVRNFMKRALQRGGIRFGMETGIIIIKMY